MSSDRIAKGFKDILDAADLIAEWVDRAGGAEAAIFRDAQVRSAIERQVLIISEAATRLNKIDPMAAPALAPGIDWPGIRGIGNFIRHRYDDLDKSVLVDVIENRLRELRSACLRALEALGSARK